MLSVTHQLLKISTASAPKMQFWAWVNSMFNKVDPERINLLGADRCTAEWLLRNGSCVKFVNALEPLCDYNVLPPENTKFLVKEILADGASISHLGFPHIKDCTKLDKIVLKNCAFIEDAALKMLRFRKDSLKHLEVIDCKNITADGMRSLKDLNLSTLVMRNLPYVKDIEGVTKELQESLKNCDIKIEK